MPKANTKNTNSRSTKHAKAVGAAKTDPIYAAIEKAKLAYKRFEEVCDIDETTGFAFASATEKRRLRAVQSKATTAHLQTLRTICNTQPTSILGIASLIEYMRADWEDNGAAYANGETDNLFSTLQVALRRMAGVPSDHCSAGKVG